MPIGFLPRVSTSRRWRRVRLGCFLMRRTPVICGWPTGWSIGTLMREFTIIRRRRTRRSVGHRWRGGMECAAIRSTLDGAGCRRVRRGRRWSVAIVRRRLMCSHGATRTGVVVAGISPIPVGIGPVISAPKGGFTRGLMNAGTATRARIVITGIAGGVVRIRRAACPGVHRAGGRLMVRATTARIGVAIAG